MASTAVRNSFQAGRLVGGELAVLVQAENQLLSFVRPSPDGKRVLVLARVYAPAVWEMMVR